MTAVPAADFEARRFQTAAAHYLEGRAPYPEALIARTAELVGLGKGDRILDLGCGPAQLALAFAPLSGEVIAMDPEPRMLAIAHEAAEGVPNVRVLEGRAEDLNDGLGPFRAVVIGRAFHWMEREQVLRTLDTLIEPGGAVVLFADEQLRIPENARMREYQALLDSYSADDPIRGHRLSDAYRSHVSVLMESPFSRLERISVFTRRRLTLEILTHRALSLSSTSRARLGRRADALIAELRTRVQAWETAGPMEEVLASNALIARRP